MLEQYENEEIVQYHGEVSDTATYIKTAHCLIHPSYYPEGVSNVCLEAAASGRPVITTNRPGCRETVEDGKTGYLFSAREREELEQCVEKFINLSLIEKRTMGSLAREKVVSEFDRKIVVDTYLKEIKSVLSNK